MSACSFSVTARSPTGPLATAEGFCSTVSRREHKDDVAAASTKATSPIDAGTTSLMQRERQRRRVAGLAVPCGAPIMEAHQCFALAHWAVSEAAWRASKSSR
jgi:hypothetical protein